MENKNTAKEAVALETEGAKLSDERVEDVVVGYVPVDKVKCPHCNRLILKRLYLPHLSNCDKKK